MIAYGMRIEDGAIVTPKDLQKILGGTLCKYQKMLERLVIKGGAKRIGHGLYITKKDRKIKDSKLVNLIPLDEFRVTNREKLVKVFLYNEITKERYGFEYGNNILRKLSVTNNIERNNKIKTIKFKNKQTYHEIVDGYTIKKLDMALDVKYYDLFALLETLAEIENYHLCKEIDKKDIITYCTNYGYTIEDILFCLPRIKCKVKVTKLLKGMGVI